MWALACPVETPQSGAHVADVEVSGCGVVSTAAYAPAPAPLRELVAEIYRVVAEIYVLVAVTLSPNSWTAALLEALEAGLWPSRGAYSNGHNFCLCRIPIPMRFFLYPMAGVPPPQGLPSIKALCYTPSLCSSLF